MSVALLFPGQGSRGIVAGLALAETSARGRALLDRAAAAAGTTRAGLHERGGRALERTEVLQPVLTAVSLAAHAALAEAGVRADVVLGCSLGEIAAWSAAGAITAEDAVDVAALRGRLMACEAARTLGGMLALAGEADLERALALAPDLVVAAWNAPDEVVIAGPDEALRLVAATVPSRRLPVTGAWHSPAMAAAAGALREALHRLPRGALRLRFVSNDDGDLVPPDAIPDRLADQLVRPARFAAALARLAALGADAFVTVGPGAVLRGLVRRNLGVTARVLGTESPADLARTAAALASPVLAGRPSAARPRSLA